MDWLSQAGIVIAAAASLYSAIKIRRMLSKQHKETLDKLEILERKITIIQNVTYRIEDDTDRIKN